MTTNAPAAQMNRAAFALYLIAGGLVIGGALAAVLASSALSRAQGVLYYLGLESSPETVAATAWIWVGAVAILLGVVLLLARLVAASLKS